MLSSGSKHQQLVYFVLHSQRIRIFQLLFNKTIINTSFESCLMQEAKRFYIKFRQNRRALDEYPR